MNNTFVRVIINIFLMIVNKKKQLFIVHVSSQCIFNNVLVNVEININ